MVKIERLAILGGPKTIIRKSPHFIWPPITKNIERAVIKQLYNSISIYDRSGVIKNFEIAFANYFQKRHALLCSSGTLAIHSMYVAAGLKEGDEVICPAYTFYATITPLLFTGAKPILCDCDENGNIDPEEIRKKITSRTKAVVVTHMWGLPAKIGEIARICQKHRLLLLEDCSHAHGATYHGKPLGSFGDISSWSIQGEKNVSGGEAGVFATNRDELYYRALLLGHYNKRCLQEIPKTNPLYRYAVTGMGLKYRATTLSATIAMEVLRKLDKYLSVKEKFAKRLTSELLKVKGLNLPIIPSSVRPSWYAFTFRYDSRAFGGLPIERFHGALLAEGLTAIDRPKSTAPVNLYPLFQTPQELFPIYRKYPFSYKPGDFPRAENLYQNILKMPVWAFQEDKSMVEAYIRGIKKVVTSYKALL